LECPVAAIVQQDIVTEIVCQIEVWKTIAVEIEPERGKGVALL